MKKQKLIFCRDCAHCHLLRCASNPLASEYVCYAEPKISWYGDAEEFTDPKSRNRYNNCKLFRRMTEKEKLEKYSIEEIVIR